MLTLEDIKPIAEIVGLDSVGIVQVKMVEPIGEQALTVYYKTPEGTLKERMIFQSDLAKLSLATKGKN